MHLFFLVLKVMFMMKLSPGIEEKQDELAVKAINKLLHRNWIILQSLISENRRICTIKRLSHYEFSFHYHTHLIQAGNCLFCFVYDTGWYIMDDKCVLLIKSGEPIY